MTLGTLSHTGSATNQLSGPTSPNSRALVQGPCCRLRCADLQVPASRWQTRPRIAGERCHLVKQPLGLLGSQPPAPGEDSGLTRQKCMNTPSSRVLSTCEDTPDYSGRLAAEGTLGHDSPRRGRGWNRSPLSSRVAQDSHGGPPALLLASRAEAVGGQAPAVSPGITKITGC